MAPRFSSSSGKRWNIFARELEAILTANNMSISLLDDRVGIHREKVRRLIQSLHTPKSFPILNPEEMILLEQKLRLSDEHMLRLRAALLATSIERMLVDRMNQDDALLAAEQIFPTILNALQEQKHSIIGLGAIKGGDDGPILNNEYDLFFEPIWQTIDDAEMKLQLSYSVTTHNERIEKVHNAHMLFEQALAELKAADDDIRTLQLWHDCKEVSQCGLAATTKRLEDLGV